MSKTAYARFADYRHEPVSGEWFTFRVNSVSEPGAENPPNLVDLQVYNWNGECNCEGFRRQCKPKLEAGDRRIRRCVHIEFCLEMAVRAVFPKLLKELMKPKL